MDIFPITGTGWTGAQGFRQGGRGPAAEDEGVSQDHLNVPVPRRSNRIGHQLTTTPARRLSIPYPGDMNEKDSDRLQAESEAVLADAVGRLEALLEELAGKLRPFPAFLGMTSVQAVEIEAAFTPDKDLGCVVVNPEGQICALEIAAIGGIAGIIETEQVEEMTPLDLGPTEYILYAGAAIEALLRELRRRGG